MKKLMILIAAGVGYVLGARAGRERYEELRRTFEKIKNDPQVQQKTDQAVQLVKDTAGQAAATVQDKADRHDNIVDAAKDVAGDVKDAAKDAADTAVAKADEKTDGKASEVLDQAKDTAEQAADTAENAAGSARQTAKETAEKVKTESKGDDLNPDRLKLSDDTGPQGNLP